MGLVTTGMGAYPSDPYYDKDRPSWLPYWIDTPTESARKYQYYFYELPATADKPYPTPNPPPAPSSPGNEALIRQRETGDTTAFTPEAQLRQDRDAWSMWRETAIPETPLEELRRKGREEEDSTFGIPNWAWLLIIVGGAVAVGALLKPSVSLR